MEASHCGGFSLLWSTGSRHAGFSSCGTWASVVAAHRLSSCGARAQLLRGMWDLPRPGLKPVSPALAGGFLTIVPPGKVPYMIFKVSLLTSIKSLVRIFAGIALNVQMNFKRSDILQHWIFPNMNMICLSIYLILILFFNEDI